MDIKSNNKLAENAIICLWAVVVCESIVFLYNFLQTVSLVIYNGKSQTNTLMGDIAGIVSVFVSATAFIMFLMWFYRAYWNLRQTTDLRRKPFWCVLSWFIPVVRLYMPFRIMKELFDRTDNVLGTTTNYKTTFYWWWILNVLLIFITVFDGGLSILHLPYAKIFEIANNTVGVIFNVISTYLLICLLKKYSGLDIMLQQNTTHHSVSFNKNEAY